MLVNILVNNNGSITQKKCLCYDTCVNCGGHREKRTANCYIQGNHMKADSIHCACKFLPHYEIFEEFKIIEMLNSLNIDTGVNFT